MPKPWMMITGAVGIAAVVLGFGLNAAMNWDGKPAAGSTGASAKAADARDSKAAGPSPTVSWVAAAPGRVEPRGGEVRIGTPILGRVIEVLIGVGVTVEEGELLVRLDDDEARARMAAAEYEAGARQQERDKLPPTPGREDVRRAEDSLFKAERGVVAARFDLDYEQAQRRKGLGSDQKVAAARRRFEEAQDRLNRDRNTFATAQAKVGLAAPSRAESMVSAGRAEVAIADAILDKTRIRAPVTGTVLQQHAKQGEMVGPTPEAPLIVLGDVSSMRVKAEVDEADVAKIRVGQRAFVRSQSYPGREFEGSVARIAPTLAPPRIGQRGPRRPTDVEVIEVTINLDGNVPLLTGMRVDAFFRR